jgi:hypothetical protein
MNRWRSISPSPSKIIYGLSLSQFGNLEFVFVKELYFQISFLRITISGKKFDFFAQKCKNLGFDRIFSFV